MQHLDCIFNIIGDDVCILAEDVIGEASPMRRVVDEYERDVRIAHFLLLGAPCAPPLPLLRGDACYAGGSAPDCPSAAQESADPGPVGGYVEGVAPDQSKPLYRLKRKGEQGRDRNHPPTTEFSSAVATAC